LGAAAYGYPQELAQAGEGEAGAVVAEAVGVRGFESKLGVALLEPGDEGAAGFEVGQGDFEVGGGG
jgi:hypothetical protein